MSFAERLNYYIEKAGLSSKELSELTGISQPTVSRYRNREKETKMTDSQLSLLATALSSRCEEGADEIFTSLKSQLKKSEYDTELIVSKLNILIDEFDINVSELAKWLNFDSSYLSRIRNGQRKPSDTNSFVGGVSSFFSRKLSKSEQLGSLCELIGSDGANVQSDLAAWLYSGEVKKNDRIFSFLSSLDSFNLDEYIKEANFEKIKIPTLPFTLPTSKYYYGIEEMRKAELDFFKIAATSKSSADMFLHNEMPITDIAADNSFFKNIMLATAVILKKGIHLNVIHNLDRPWHEMMMGLEGWIPLYMTGRISPYYMKSASKGPYKTSLHTAGTVVLEGGCADGFPKDGRYYLTTAKSEVAYYNRLASHAISLAQPLMKVYDRGSGSQYLARLSDISLVEGDRRIINSTLPVYTLSAELFSEICSQNGISAESAKKMYADVLRQRRKIEEVISKNTYLEEVRVLSEEEFKSEKHRLCTSDFFFDVSLCYSFETYKKHLALTEEFASDFKNYKLRKNENAFFKNIRIVTVADKYAIISKELSPTIHFVIQHPKLVKAIAGFEPEAAEQQ
ncbi:MAG: helix-turn-helix transcriptional regulator [Clostridia bacterium]|nr:helix-turn-helix transcriptional regulator [Clostridia bacterium]